MPAPEAGALRARAQRLLARREHSRDELRRKLGAQEAVPADVVEAVLDELQQAGWLSEQRLAEQLVRAARDRYGSRRVLQRLREKGISGETLEQATASLAAQDLDSARALWRKRFGKPPATLQEKARQERFLAGRGFSGEVIGRLLGHLDDD
ncbi:MAG: recombination regulator RecX [Burkholderiales bacterium]|nr:recombination regulator RecX [Burkholderiales bacterium]